jgi:hypothetical protein
MLRAAVSVLRRSFAATTTVGAAPIRPRFKKVEGLHKIIEGKPMRVRNDNDDNETENDDDDAKGHEGRVFEDVKQHIEFGLVRHRTPLLDKCKIGFVSLPEEVQLRLNAVVRTVPRDRILVHFHKIRTIFFYY